MLVRSNKLCSYTLVLVLSALICWIAVGMASATLQFDRLGRNLCDMLC